MKPCKKCNGQGYYMTQPLSAKALHALAEVCPDEPVTVVESLCDCGNTDARATHEVAMAWSRLLKTPPPQAKGD